MPLDDTDVRRIEEILDRKLDALVGRIVAQLRQQTVSETPIPRLTVDQFATAVELHIVTVRRKIRVGEIPREFVYGSRSKRISPKALALFGVTPPEALARLAAHNLRPTLLQSAA